MKLFSSVEHLDRGDIDRIESALNGSDWQELTLLLTRYGFVADGRRQALDLARTVVDKWLETCEECNSGDDYDSPTNCPYCGGAEVFCAFGQATCDDCGESWPCNAND